MSTGVVKMKQGMSYSCKEKTIILNVFKYFKTVHPTECITEIVRRTSKATGCSEKSVFQFRKEEASAEGFKEPSKTKVRKNININSRFIKYDENVRQAIRTLIYELKNQNIIPSLNTLLRNINSNDRLPNFSVMTLRRLLRDMGFYYERERVGNKAILVERPDKALDVKKENVPLNNKKHQIQNNVNSQLVTHSNDNMSQIDTEVDAKHYPLPQNNPSVESSQLFIPNQSHRPFPVSLSHQDNLYLNRQYMGPHEYYQMHAVPINNMKPSNINYLQPIHPQTVVLQ